MAKLFFNYYSLDTKMHTYTKYIHPQYQNFSPFFNLYLTIFLSSLTFYGYLATAIIGQASEIWKDSSHQYHATLFFSSFSTSSSSELMIGELQSRITNTALFYLPLYFLPLLYQRRWMATLQSPKPPLLP